MQSDQRLDFDFAHHSPQDHLSAAPLAVDAQLQLQQVTTIDPPPEHSSLQDALSAAAPSSSSHCPNFSHLFTLLGHTRAITSLSFSPNGLFLASASADKTVRIWSLRTGHLLQTLKGHAAGISDLAWSPCSTYLATASDDKTIGVWNAISGYDLRHLLGHTSYVFCVAYSPQSNLIVSGSFDETVRLWDVMKGTCHRTIAAHSEAVTDVDFNCDGTLIASCSYDGLIRLWDVPTGLCLATLPHPTSSPTTSIRFSPSSSHLLASSLDSTLRLWDVTSGKIVKTYRGHKESNDASSRGVYENQKFAIKSHFLILPPLGSCARAQNNSVAKGRRGRQKSPEVFIVSGSEDSKVYLWHLQSRRHPTGDDGGGAGGGIVGAGLHRDIVSAVAVHPRAAIIASAGMEHDPSIRVWFDSSRSGGEGVQKQAPSL